MEKGKPVEVQGLDSLLPDLPLDIAVGYVPNAVQLQKRLAEEMPVMKTDKFLEIMDEMRQEPMLFRTTNSESEPIQ